MDNFCTRLVSLRKEKDLTQEALARQLGITRSRLAMYEQGNREPDFEMQELIADFFNVDLDYLMGRKEKKHTTFYFDSSSLVDSDFEEALQYAIDFMSELTYEDKITLKLFHKLPVNEVYKAINILQTIFPKQFEMAVKEVEEENEEDDNEN